ncbi:DUF6456 domain-containing protein [Nitratireductor sp. GISD-1A_MAKvit]|uniref:DUF6456 domain-containing protein n=1 Tax=Nitratireductor sp. GISD-1A_MAKvit TaxID=3234198 RepID=UPI003466F87D
MAALKAELRVARDRRRALRFLQKGPAWRQNGARPNTVLLDGGERGTISIELDVLKQLEREDLVRCKIDTVALSGAGSASLQRQQSRHEPFREQHWNVEKRVLGTGREKQIVSATLSESPLAQLARRRMRNGTAFLTQAEFDAGERLRADYTHGQIMPRLSARWMEAVSSGKRTGAAGEGVELSDSALAARQRVDGALEAVGPELAGILVDICCFLKGFEQVETERGWPVRSAKVVLKTALGALDRHYAPKKGRAGRGRKSILHWGADGYRPNII